MKIFKTTSFYQGLKMAMRICCAISISFILTQYEFYAAEAFLYDIRFRLKPTSPTSNLIVTVNVDEKTLGALDRKPVVSDHIQFLKRLKSYNPRYLIYTIDPSKLDGTNKEREQLARLGESLNIIYAANNFPKKGLDKELELPYPYKKWNSMPGPKTREEFIFAKDLITRRMVVSAFGRPSLHKVLSQKYRNKNEPIKGLYEFEGSQQTFIDFKPTGTYPEFSFYDVLESKNKLFLQDKIVIVGLNERNSTSHYIKTPFSKSMFAMPISEMQANMLDTLILNSGITKAPKWVNFLVTCTFSLIILFVILRVRPIKGLATIIALTMSLGLIAYLAFAFFNYSLHMVQPLITMFACYYFFIPYRLIIESREKWEFQKKNKLLMQVEEMKNNFMRMMSHDLKTPLARIQGMSDITLTDAGGLSERQKNAVLSIKDSSQELSELITSILDLGRVENQGVKLHLQSRDINSIINKLVSKLDYLAQKKNITLITELDPLFSLKIDEHLIKQALTNLIENAIKYSPENSKVLITSEEVDNEIQVQVSDQGIGIGKDELEHVFEKFYRSKDVTNKDIKGSGLGLYLSQYFVGLHNGDISVESQPNEGSTFTLSLPIDMN